MRKILILTNDLELGGIQKSLVEYLRYLVKFNAFEVDLLVWQEGGPLQKFVPEEVHIIFQQYPVSLNNIIKEKNKLRKIKLWVLYFKLKFCSIILRKPWLYYSKITKQYDIAISFTHNGYPRFFAIDRVSADQKFLWFHHGSYISKGKEKYLDARYYQKFNKIIPVSEANKIMLSEHFPELVKRFFVIPNIINAPNIISLANELIQDMPKKADIYNFVTVTRFSGEKGLDLAIKVASEVKERGIQFKWYFIGDGELFLDIQNLAKKLYVADCCVFLGRKENPYPYIKNADVYIQTSYVEAHPLTINEALVLNKIIVATDLPSIRETLLNGELGILCNPEPKIFAAQILKLLQNDKMHKSLLGAVHLYDVDNTTTYEKINKLMWL